MRRLVLILLASLVTAASAAAAGRPTTTATTTQAGTPTTLQINPVARLPFPERGYVVDLPRSASVDFSQVHVTENGRPIGDVAFSPLTSSGLRFGVVLAIDSSDSMNGKPFNGAIDAAGKFVSHRAKNEMIGLVAFNDRVHVVEPLTTDAQRLDNALAHPPALAYGTHIYDAVGRSLGVLTRAHLTTGAIVLLSDGTDVGSTSALKDVIAAANRQHVRVFTVGLRSKTFDPTTLQNIAAFTGATYAEATSPAQLANIYSALSTRLAGEYLLQYRSNANPKSHVNVQVSVDGFGKTSAQYTAPTPAALPPYHRSLVSRFVLSPLSLAALAIAIAVLLGWAIRAALESHRSHVVERVRAFAGSDESDENRVDLRKLTRDAREAGARRAHVAFAGLARDLEIANSDWTATRVVLLTCIATVLAFILLLVIAPVFSILAFIVPFISRSMVKRRLKKVRDAFADQLAPNLQVLASALRSGHSFAGALTVTVEHAGEPSKRELSRAVADDQLGVPMDEALRRVAGRMASRDLEQVALVAELQRTTGGNVAEVLDTVVGTLRERADIRRLLRTLTAQGRMARWILTGLPIATGLAFWAIQPDIVGPMYHTTGGQIAIVIAAIMVAIGSFSIQKIIDVEV
jgi:tight adherence protein B